LEYVDEAYAWFGWSTYASKKDNWLGHGYFWRGQPEGHTEQLDNMAGSSLHDFDMFEDKFAALKKASVITADYNLIKADFPELKHYTNSEIDNWLLENAAFVSEGMVERMRPGGDHHELLGIDKLGGGFASLVDVVGKPRSGIRIRSGGRAATFITDNGRYTYTEDNSEPTPGATNHGRPIMKAGMLDVKVLGVHVNSNYRKSEKTTGLLNFADALRELGF